jgi:hypothetical protein
MEECQGLMAMSPKGTLRLSHDLSIEDAFHAKTAFLFQIPVCEIPQVAEPHLGADEIHRISDNATAKFLVTCDPGWLIQFP